MRERYTFSQYILDPNKFRFRKVVRILAIVKKFIRNSKSRMSSTKHRGRVTNDVLTLTNDEIDAAEKYYYQKASEEVRHFLKPKQYSKISKEHHGILYYTGRILPDDNVSIVGKMTKVMHDLCSTSFFVPIIDKHSPIAYSLVNEVHWHNETVRHRGVESVWRYVLKKVYIIEGRDIVKSIKKSCQRCRYLEKKTIDVLMGPISDTSLTIAPAFYHTQVDLTGPYSAYSNHNQRKTIKVWLAIFCCNSTYATSIKVMENYSTDAFIRAFIRFSCQFGYPRLMLSDEGSQIIKAFQSMELKFVDLQQKMHKENGVEYQTCPVGGHNMNGRVERKIREIKSSMARTLINNRLSIMQWETTSAQIANCINNLPLALGNLVSDFETMDLLTPNRLLMGRNNDRSPDGNMIILDDFRKRFEVNNAIFITWFENWLLTHVPKLMLQPKWFKSDEHLKTGDVVLFLKSESVLSSTYQYGIIESTFVSKDGRIRKVEVRYRNHNESVDRFTFRAVRHLVLIHHVDDVGIMKELDDMAVKE